MYTTTTTTTNFEDDEGRPSSPESSLCCCWFSCLRSNKIDSGDDDTTAAATTAAVAATEAAEKAKNGNAVPGNNNVAVGGKTKKSSIASSVIAENNEFTKSDKLIRSTLLIQRWYRRYKSRIEMRKLTAWNIYKSIEYSGEQTQLKLYDFFLTLIRNQSLLHGGRNGGALTPLSPGGSVGATESHMAGPPTSRSGSIVGGTGSGGSGPGGGGYHGGRKQSLFSVNTSIDPTFLLEPDESVLGTGLDSSNIGVINRIFENESQPNVVPRKN